MSGRGPSLAGLWFDIFKWERGMPHYDIAKYYQWEAAHFVDPKSGEALVSEREAINALKILVYSLRDACAKQRLEGEVPCRTERVHI